MNKKLAYWILGLSLGTAAALPPVLETSKFGKEFMSITTVKLEEQKKLREELNKSENALNDAKNLLYDSERKVSSIESIEKKAQNGLANATEELDLATNKKKSLEEISSEKTSLFAQRQSEYNSSNQTIDKLKIDLAEKEKQKFAIISGMEGKDELIAELQKPIPYVFIRPNTAIGVSGSFFDGTPRFGLNFDFNKKIYKDFFATGDANLFRGLSQDEGVIPQISLGLGKYITERTTVKLLAGNLWTNNGDINSDYEKKGSFGIEASKIFGKYDYVIPSVGIHMVDGEPLIVIKAGVDITKLK